MGSPYPLRTERLTLRVMQPADAQTMAAYRSDPEVAKHQLWDAPFPVEKAREVLADLEGVDDVRLGEWTTFAVEVSGEVVGDVVCNVDETGGVAELGYTIAREHWGRGYSWEAARALADDLVERIGVGRLVGELDPVNVASQRVLESVGLVFEAVTLRSFWWRGEWTDNMHYGATAEQYRAWRDRPRHPVGSVRVVPLDAATWSSYAALRTHHSQERFARPPLEVCAAAQFAPDPVLLRGIEADGSPAGLVLVRPTAEAWRIETLLVDRAWQRRGVGRAALAEVGALARAAGATSLSAAAADGPGNPGPFLRACGFGDRGGAPVLAL